MAAIVHFTQSDQKENKSEQALQNIGHVVVESYANKCSMHLWSQTPLYNTSYLMNFRHCNYNCAFYSYYMIMEKIYKTNKINIFLHLLALLLNATPLVSRFFGEMSNKRQF
jgi:hypothetical protein